MWYLEAYDTLSFSRRIGFGMGPIPLSEYRAYAESFGVPESFEKFVAIMQAIDVAYLLKANSDG